MGSHDHWLYCISQRDIKFPLDSEPYWQLTKSLAPSVKEIGWHKQILFLSLWSSKYHTIIWILCCLLKLSLSFNVHHIYLYEDSVPAFAKVLLSKIRLLACFILWMLVKLRIRKKVALKLINVDLIIKTAVSAPSNFCYISQFSEFI